jgi:HAD superfamily hydrolase (TIGR01509 family)
MRRPGRSVKRRVAPRVLLLDIGNVVVWDTRPRVVRAICRQEQVAPAELRATYYRLCRRAGAGKLDLREIYAILRGKFHLSLGFRSFRELVTSRSLVAIPGVLPRLRTLHRQGSVRVVFASNIERYVWQGLCQKFDLRSAADEYALSFRLGVLKPRAEFFRRALRLARAAPSETLYLDDLPENIAAARRIGIPSRRVRSPSEVVSILGQLGTGRPERREDLYRRITPTDRSPR